MLPVALTFALLAPGPKIHILDALDEPLRPAIEVCVAEGVQRIEKFFGLHFPQPFEVYVYPSRKEFDKMIHEKWRTGPSQPWAVAAGVGDGMYLLSPRVWKTEAVEHDPDNEGHVRRIIAHELVHVFHGQLNPSADFEGMDDLAWLVEGLATYVSGQLDGEHKGKDAEAIVKAAAPTSLATAWSGRYRYAVSGSLVRFLDGRYGRAMLKRVLGCTTNLQVLSALKTTETWLVEDWKASLSPKR